MINYLTCKRYIDYTPALRPSDQPVGAGGMSIKTFCTTEALKQTYPTAKSIYNASDIDERIVLVEPLRLSMNPSDVEQTKDEVLTDLQKHKANGGIIIAYCSEFALIKLPPGDRKTFLNLTTGVSANCKFQSRLFRAHDIVVNGIIPDPTPPYFFQTNKIGQRKRHVVACGQISSQKNSQQTIEVFKRVNLPTTYIGSASLWSGKATPENKALELEMADVATNYIHEATPYEVAKIMQTHELGLWCCIHDCFATALHQMLAASLRIVTARHGLSEDVPVYIESGVENQVKKLESLAKEIEEGNLDTKAEEAMVYAQTETSYSAFATNLQNLLRKTC